MLYLRLPDEPSAEQVTYRIKDYDPPVPDGIFCREALAEYIHDVTTAHTPWEDWIVIQALIKKGALIPS